MADIRSLIRSMNPDYVLRNARKEVIEHARIVAQVDALARRLNTPVETLDQRRRAS